MISAETPRAKDKYRGLHVKLKEAQGLHGR